MLLTIYTNITKQSIFIELKKRTFGQTVTRGFKKAIGQLLYQTESSDFTNKNVIIT